MSSCNFSVFQDCSRRRELITNKYIFFIYFLILYAVWSDTIFFHSFLSEAVWSDHLFCCPLLWHYFIGGHVVRALSDVLNETPCGNVQQPKT